MIFDNNIFLKSNKSVNLDLVFDNKNLQNGGTKNKEGKTQETSKNNAVFKQLVSQEKWVSFFGLSFFFQSSPAKYKKTGSVFQVFRIDWQSSK